MEEKFKNPKLQKLYEMLCELYPNRVFWQDIGEDNLSGSYLDYLREQEKN